MLHCNRTPNCYHPAGMSHFTTHCDGNKHTRPSIYNHTGGNDASQLSHLGASNISIIKLLLSDILSTEIHALGGRAWDLTSGGEQAAAREDVYKSPEATPRSGMCSYLVCHPPKGWALRLTAGHSAFQPQGQTALRRREAPD